MQYIYFACFVLIVTAIVTIARWAIIIIASIAAIWFSLWLLSGIYRGLRWIYHIFSPSARKRFLARQASEKAAAEQREREVAAYKAEEERKNKEKESAKRRVQEEKERVANEENARRELARQHHRDADIQERPYTYEIGQHANEALAIRYGIANQERIIEEYYYFAKGGIRTRNPSRDKIYWVPSKTITLKKLQPLNSDQFIAALSDHGERKVRVVIERGTEYVKTFLPLDDAWFHAHKKLEETLKNNKSFSLKELASFHVQKTV